MKCDSMRGRELLIGLLFLPFRGYALPVTPDDPIYYLKAEVAMPPKLVHRADLSFTDDARRAGLEGDVVLAFTINRNGAAEDQIVLSSLGYGLDQQAMRAVSQWRFLPAVKDGHPVRFRATASISFLFSKAPDTALYQRQSTERAVATLVARQQEPQLSNDSVGLVEGFAEMGDAPAWYVLGRWLIQGAVLPKDETKGWQEIEAAARKGDTSALRFEGNSLLEGTIIQQDKKKGLSYLSEAAGRGDPEAQLDLGSRYMDGDGLAADVKKARKYLAACAATGHARCEKRLAKLGP